MCLSVMVQSTNRRCNAMQSVIGLFLQSAGTPGTVVELLSRLGVSITTSSINNTVNSLMSESIVALKRIGRTLLVAYAYDNINIDLKHAIPTGDARENTLIHLTSGTFIRLNHGVTSEDLACSEYLWRRSKRNPRALAIDVPPMMDYIQLLNIHPESDHPSGLTRREHFNHWVFLRDLITHGGPYFQQFRRMLVKPETIDQIPVVKSQQVPCRMMDINPSSNAMNVDVIKNLCKQAGVGDSKENSGVKDINDQVIIIHSDLLTGERIESIQDTRSVEEIPWRRLQYAIYVLGLFHLKMVCADAIWRLFIQATAGCPFKTNSLIHHVSIIRPRETGKIESKPGFRRMHKVIEHVGLVSRLDCWRLEVEKSGFGSLEAFAESEPSWDLLNRIAVSLVWEHVADSDFSNLRSQPLAQRDQVRENVLLRQQNFLLYKEIAYALNEGDIGRVEDTFMPWVFIFRGCGKHKYAAHMMKYLHNVHFVYPEGLR